MARIVGSTGDDLIRGTARADSILGGAGDDWIDASGGTDTSTPGTGHDVVVIEPRAAETVLRGARDGFDILLGFRGSTGDPLHRLVWEDVRADQILFYRTGDHAGLVDLRRDGQHVALDGFYGFSTPRAFEVEFRDGGTRSFLRQASAEVTTPFSMQGGSPGSDILSHGQGEFGSAWLWGGGGSDVLSSAKSGLLTGQGGDDRLVARSTLGGIKDRPAGDVGLLMTGGSGNDTFVVGPGQLAVLTDRGTGTDLLEIAWFRPGGTGMATGIVGGRHLFLAETATNSIVLVWDFARDRDGIDRFTTAVGTLTRAQFEARLGAVPAVSYAALGTDGAAFEAGVERLFALSGNDRGPTLDLVVGGGLPGSASTLWGADGDDTMIDSGPVRELRGGAGNDRYLLNRPSAADVVEAPGQGSDTILVNAGLSNTIFELPDHVENLRMLVPSLAAGVQGNAAGNRIAGHRGDDVLLGEGGNDVLAGHVGDDVLSGGTGNDRLRGGAGRDLLHGGAGGDRFEFGSLSDSTSRAPDRIADFSRAERDRIDLSAIDARPSAGGNQAFAFLGDAPFTAPGQVRAVRSGEVVVVSLNTDSDRQPEMVFEVVNPLALRASDFLL